MRASILHSLALSVYAIACANGFRILSSNSDPAAATRAVFEPYVKGGVGYFGDPANPDPERVNEGGPFSPDTPRIYLYGTPKQNCPGMVGPVNEQEYYCRGREYGYCDRRSGLCVCNQGYTGLDCTECKPSYFKKGSLCYAKKSCPKDCSRAGVCDYETGACCADPLLNSVRRSGARKVDDPLPFDELAREFSFTFSYGSQDPRVFDEAEVFELAPFSTTPTYLNDSSVSCVQGTRLDASWVCQPNRVSHRVCGHAGVFSFTSPIYAVPETAQNITLTVQRSGGGMGDATVMYDVQHITTNGQDVTPTAFYTSSQVLHFTHGIVNMSFLLTIHDDHVVEADESFRVILRSPSDGSSLGNQREALVTILDDDLPRTDAALTYVVAGSGTILEKGGYAGDPLSFQIQAVLGDGSMKKTGSGDVIIMESYVADESETTDEMAVHESLYRPKKVGQVADNANGTYTVTWQRKQAGGYTVAAYLLYPGGLLGDYYADGWFTGTPIVSRIDRQLNFTWNRGPLFSGASDYVSVRWSGRLKPKTTGDVTFYVTCDDHVRLWVGDVLLIDRWSLENDGGVDAQATMALDATLYYSLQIEYRDLTGDARISLSWSAPTLSKEVIPAPSLYAAQHIHGSPFTNVPILPALAASPATSYLQGTFATVAGMPLSLQLFPVDTYGNARKAFDGKVDLYEARMSLTTDLSLGGIGSKNVDCEILWRAANATFSITCIPFFSGTHSLNVYLNSVLVTGSPFAVSVTPNKMNPTRSVLSGSGLTTSRIAGATTTVVLETRDLHNNRIYTSNAASRLVLLATHTTKSGVVDRGAVADNGDGTYTFTYTPRFAGTYLIHITQNSAHIHNSPNTVTVVPNVAVGSTSVATGGGLTAASTNVQASFQIQSRDSNSNDLTAGGAVYQVILEHTTKGNVTGTCTDLLNSKYACTYTPKYVGLSKLHVGLWKSSVFTAIAGSPFAINVVAGPTLGSLCLATGTALVSSIAGQSTSFTVFIRDYFDNAKINAGTEAVGVAFVGPAPSTATLAVANTALQVVYNGDGTFTVSYSLQKKGAYSIKVTVNGVAVHGSPFSMYTYPALASHLTTTIDLLSPALATPPTIYTTDSPIQTRITARDLFSNVLETGGYLFEFDASFGNKTLMDAVGLVDEKNGSYLFTFTPRIAQKYSLAQRIMYPSGLNATFFSTPDLVGSAKLTRVDKTIDFDFGLQPPFNTDASETFSIQWAGYLLPRYSEIYTIHVTLNGGAQLQINKQLVFPSAHLWPSASTAKRYAQIPLLANQLVPIELNFSKPRRVRNASIHLEWESMSQRREVVPASQLFTGWTYVTNVPPLSVVPGNAHSRSFTAVFPDGTLSPPNLLTAIAGDPFVFFVTARDQFGNLRLGGGDTIFVLFPELATSVDITPVVVDYSNATYKITISPIVTGDFSMVIAATRPSDNIPVNANKAAFITALQPFLIQQSPFTLRVVSNEPLATTSTLVGSGIVSAVAGIPASVVVELRDVHSNLVQQRPVLASTITVRLRLLTDPSITYDAALGDAVGGLLPVTYTATRTGIYEIVLAVAKNGPLVRKLATLRVTPTLASALASIASGAGLGPQVHTKTLLAFQIDLRDVYQNPKEVGGNDLAVTLRGPATVYGDVVDLNTGFYTVHFQLPLAGKYEIQSVLAHPGHGLVGYYFENTRFSSVPVASTTHWVDPALDFDWTANETMRNYPRIQWRGYLKPRFTETYKLRLSVFPAGAVYIDGIPVIDAITTLDTSDGGGSTVFEADVDLAGGRSHRIVVEYRSPSQRNIRGFLQLQWRSDRQPAQVIPTTAFLPDGQELQPRYIITAIDI